MVTAGDKYRHHKGNEYEIVCVAIDHDSNRRLVIYRSIAVPGKILARLLDDFESPVIADGISQPRYVKL